MTYILTIVSLWAATCVFLLFFGGTQVSVFLSIGGTAALLMHAALFGGKSHVG